MGKNGQFLGFLEKVVEIFEKLIFSAHFFGHVAIFKKFLAAKIWLKYAKNWHFGQKPKKFPYKRYFKKFIL